MDSLSYKTISHTKATARKEWVVVDAAGQPVGRVASTVAKLIRGKHKTNFTPNADCGDFVIVLNASEAVFTGNKLDQKQYVRHTGYPGGQRFTPARRMMETYPERVIEKAVKGMLPKNRLGRAIYGNMHVYAGNQHPHEAQKPKTINLATFK